MAVRRSRKSEKSPLSPEAVLAGSSLAPKPAREPKAPKAVKAPKAKTAKAPAVLLDYPQAGESVQPGHYAIRVAAKDGATVEVSIDGSAWVPCRSAVGYFWFDWEPSLPGTHTILARAKNGGPRFALSEERKVVVLEPEIL